MNSSSASKNREIHAAVRARTRRRMVAAGSAAPPTPVAADAPDAAAPSSTFNSIVPASTRPVGPSHVTV